VGCVVHHALCLAAKFRELRTRQPIRFGESLQGSNCSLQLGVHDGSTRAGGLEQPPLGFDAVIADDARNEYGAHQHHRERRRDHEKKQMGPQREDPNRARHGGTPYHLSRGWRPAHLC
jgi:hypothetical protein